MTPLQKSLLTDLLPEGGVYDRYYRIVAMGTAHNQTTSLACFCRGWLEVCENRIYVSPQGRAAVEAEE